MKTAILVVDTIEDFFSHVMTESDDARKRAGSIVAPLKNLLKQAREQSVPVVYIYDYFTYAEAEIDAHLKIHGRHAVEGTTGVKVLEDIAPQPEDFVIYKKVYDGFYGTRLDMVLRELDVKRIAVTGLWTDICVMHTVMGGWVRRYETILVEDCANSQKEEEMLWALEYMRKNYGTKTINSNDLIGMLRGPGDTK